MKKQTEYALGMDRGKVIIWTLLFLVIGVILFGLPGYFILRINYTDLNIIIFTVLLVSSFILHELLHGLGWVIFGDVHWDTLRFGFLLSKGLLFIHNIKPSSMRVYRYCIILPGLLQGLLLPIAGLVFVRGWLVIIGIIMFSGAAGDLIVLWKTRDIPGDKYVLDYPDRIGLMLINDIDKSTAPLEKDFEQLELLDLKGYLRKGLFYILLSSLVMMVLYYTGYYGGRLAAVIFK